MSMESPVREEERRGSWEGNAPASPRPQAARPQAARPQAARTTRRQASDTVEWHHVVWPLLGCIVPVGAGLIGGQMLGVWGFGLGGIVGWFAILFADSRNAYRDRPPH
jgi:hypothetical protein